MANFTNEQNEELLKQMESLNEEQLEAATTINGPLLVLAGAGSGKALKNGSKVQTPNGPINIEDLRVGDEVFNTYGSTSKVQGVFPQGEKQVWEVEFSDGTIIECCEEHLWTYQTSKQRTSAKPFQTDTIKNIYENVPLRKKAGQYDRWNIYIPMPSPVSYKEKNLPLDPYLLGSMIGDGGFTSNSITFSNSESDILLKVEKLLKEIGYKLTQNKGTNDFFISMIKREKVSKLRLTLNEMGLQGLKSNEKFIPKNYLQSSIQQRVELLKGLIDTDGECEGSSYIYSTTSVLLKNDIEELCRSLGFTVTSKERQTYYSYNGERKEGKPSYRITIKTSKKIEKIHSSEKHEESFRMGQSQARLTIRDIRPTENMAPMTCISVDAKDSLFLTDNFIVTHNTKSMTVRIANMIKSGISPYNILAMTFTNKAAGEMKERLALMVGEEAIKGIWMSTFHSACIKILRRDAHRLGYQKTDKGFASFSIFDPEDAKKIIKDIFKSLNIVGKYKEAAALSYIDTCKNKLWEPKHAEMYYSDSEQEATFSKVYELYQKELMKNNAIDFGDMIMKTVEVLRDFPEAASYWQNKFHYILIDEFQDSNYAQLQLILLLSSPHFNLFAVGDFRQSIYKFRGSDISIILGFKKMFPSGKVVHLLKNYRSQSNIVNVGNYIIDNNKTEFNRDLEAYHNEGKKVNVVSVGTEFHEAAFVASTIKKAVMSGEREYKDFAILYRSNAQSRVIEDIFRNQFIPTKMVNGTGFYEREEIKDIVSYLRSLYNVKDSLALLRIINKPARGVGKTTLKKVEEFSEKNNITLFSALQHINNMENISKRSIKPVENFFALMKKIKDNESKFESKSRFVEYVIQMSGLRELYKGTTSTLIEKEENLKEFVKLVAEFEMAYPDKSLEDFIMEMSLSSSNKNKDEDDNAVKLMTIHASKGLEFPVVFCVAWSETIFPGFRATTKEDIEEERRVAYVAITRAEEELFIIHADQRRQINGSLKKHEPSRFISELPEDLIHEIELFKHGEKKANETIKIKKEASMMGINTSSIKDFDKLSPEEKFNALMQKEKE